MNSKPPISAPPGLKLGDIYHVLFRHKWKILIVWTLGLIAAVALWKLWPVQYQSEAKLLVRYILESAPVSPVGNGNIQVPDSRGNTVMSSEIEILRSFDLAKEVASNIGPAAVLAKAGGSNDLNKAAAVIAKGLRRFNIRAHAIFFKNRFRV